MRDKNREVRVPLAQEEWADWGQEERRSKPRHVDKAQALGQV